MLTREAERGDSGKRVRDEVGGLRAPRTNNGWDMRGRILLEMEGGIGLVGVDGPVTQLLRGSGSRRVDVVDNVGSHCGRAGGGCVGEVSLEDGTVGVYCRHKTGLTLLGNAEGDDRGAGAWGGRWLRRARGRVGERRGEDADGLGREVAGLRVEGVRVRVREHVGGQRV